MKSTPLPVFDPQYHVFHRAKVGGQTPLPESMNGATPQRVWRVLDVKGIEGLGLIHNRTAFLEDMGHDWKITHKGELRYSTRQADLGQWLDIILDYDPPHVYALRRAQGRFDPMTGQPLSEPQSRKGTKRKPG